MQFMGKLGLEMSRKGLGETLTIKQILLTFTLSVNKIIIYQFSMFKSLDSIASVVGNFMYLTISKFKQVLRYRKGLGNVSTTTLVVINNILILKCGCIGLYILQCNNQHGYCDHSYENLNE